MDKCSVTLQPHTLGYTLEGVKNSGHRGKGRLAIDIFFPLADRVLELLQFQRALLEKCIKKILKDLGRALTGIAEFNSGRHKPALTSMVLIGNRTVLHCRKQLFNFLLGLFIGCGVVQLEGVNRDATNVVDIDRAFAKAFEQ